MVVLIGFKSFPSRLVTGPSDLEGVEYGDVKSFLIGEVVAAQFEGRGTPWALI